MCGVVKLSISSLTAHTAGHGLDRDAGKVRQSVWVQRVPTSNRTRTSPSSAVAIQTRQSMPRSCSLIADTGLVT